jgi:hypothetical protein
MMLCKALIGLSFRIVSVKLSAVDLPRQHQVSCIAGTASYVVGKLFGRQAISKVLLCPKIIKITLLAPGVMAQRQPPI